MKYKLIFLFASFALVATSCKKKIDHKSTTADDLTNAQYRTPVYPSDHELIYDSTLLALQWGLVELSQNSDFRDSVHFWCAQQFDGDYNVPTRYVHEHWPGFDVSLTNSINLHAPSPAPLLKYVPLIVDGFDYFDGKAFPQIYVPNYTTTNLNTAPMICLNLNDDATLPGIIYDGYSITTDPAVTESYSGEDLVWVTSCNETLLSDADYLNYGSHYIQTLLSIDSLADSTISTPGGLGIRRWKREVGVTLKKGKFTTTKEGWGNGRGDITIAFGHWNPDCSTMRKKSKFPVAKLKDNQINQWIDLVNGCHLAQLAVVGGLIPPYTDSQNLWVMVYEYDRRKKFARTFEAPSFDHITGCLHAFHYQSKEAQYGDINFHWVWWDGHYDSMGTRTINCGMNGGNEWIQFDVFR